VELVHEDVGAGQVDLGERLALHADGRHEALARIVALTPQRILSAV